MTRLLVIDCYDKKGMAALQNVGATLAGQLYKNMLGQFLPEGQIDIVEISHMDMQSIDIGAYDGACWTGSNLFISSGDAAVKRQIQLCSTLFKSGMPQFGSCWAAQLAAVVAGGTVAPNPKGREFGLARKIGLTDAGKSHPMYKGKPPIFDGFTSHRDHITKMPEGGTLLAFNSFSPVQALSVKFSKGEFWAIQYHPEYDFSEVAALALARQEELIKQRTFQSQAALDSYVADLRTLNNEDSRDDIAWKLGIDSDLRNPSTKTIEVKNWLSHFFDIHN